MFQEKINQHYEESFLFRKKIANKLLRISSLTLEEAESEVNLKFVELCKKFDESRNVPFFTFFYSNMQFFLKDYQAKQYTLVSTKEVLYAETSDYEELIQYNDYTEKSLILFDSINSLSNLAQSMIEKLFQSNYTSKTQLERYFLRKGFKNRKILRASYEIKCMLESL